MKFWEVIARIYCFIFLGKSAEWNSGNAKIVVVKRLFPPWAVAQTWGRLIFVRGPYLRIDKLIDHEKVHVEQWNDKGFLFPFIYFWLMFVSLLKHGPKKAYFMHPYEVEARELADL